MIPIRLANKSIVSNTFVIIPKPLVISNNSTIIKAIAAVMNLFFPQLLLLEEKPTMKYIANETDKFPE